MLLGILLTLHIIVCISLIGVVLIQRSEGGALGMGGGSNAFMSARGAGDFLTRLTWILASVFFALSLTLTFMAGRERSASSVVDRLKIEAVDPSKLNRAPLPTAPTTPVTGGGAAPLEAPTPQVRNPLLGEPATTETAPASAPAKP